MREQAVADGEIVIPLTEGMQFRLLHRRTAHVLTRHRSEHGGRALHRRTLQVVLDGAHATQFLAPTGTTGAAVLELGQR